MGRQCRKEAKTVIEKVVTKSKYQNGFIHIVHIEKEMKEAYPFGNKDFHAYDVYKKEMDRQLERLRKGG